MPQCFYHENPLPSNIQQGALSITSLPSNIRQGALISPCAIIMSCLVLRTIHKSATLQSLVRCTIYKSATLQSPVGCNNQKSATLKYPVGCNNLSMRSNHVVIHLYPMTIWQPLCIAQNRDPCNPPCSHYVLKIIPKIGI